MPAYTMPSYELPHIGSSSHQLVPRRPDRPKSNYGHRTSSPSRPRSALMGRPKSAGGRLKTKPEPSSTRYGYDSYGQRVRIRKEVCIYRVDDTFQVLAWFPVFLVKFNWFQGCFVLFFKFLQFYLFQSVLRVFLAKFTCFYRILFKFWGYLSDTGWHPGMQDSYRKCDSHQRIVSVASELFENLSPIVDQNDTMQYYWYRKTNNFPVGTSFSLQRIDFNLLGGGLW